MGRDLPAGLRGLRERAWPIRESFHKLGPIEALTCGNAPSGFDVRTRPSVYLPAPDAPGGSANDAGPASGPGGASPRRWSAGSSSGAASGSCVDRLARNGQRLHWRRDASSGRPRAIYIVYLRYGRERMRMIEPERELVRRVLPYAVPAAIVAFAARRAARGRSVGWSAAIGVARRRRELRRPRPVPRVGRRHLADRDVRGRARRLRRASRRDRARAGAALNTLAWFSPVAFLAAVVPATIVLLGSR